MGNERKEITIVPPNGYEIDEEKSTFEKIVFKKVIFKENFEEPIKTYNDLIHQEKLISGFYGDLDSRICEATRVLAKSTNKHLYLTKKQLRSAFAMAMISQLMPYYGGEVTHEDWKNKNEIKYIIRFRDGNITTDSYYSGYYSYLAFHELEQRTEFMRNNKSLILDYFMV